MVEEKERVLTLYDVYYCFSLLGSLEGKTEYASYLPPRFYRPPDVSNDLEGLIALKSVQGFEDVGKWAEDWLRYIQSQGLPQDACKILWAQSGAIIGRLYEKLNREYTLMYSKLEILNTESLRKGAEGFFDKETIEWLKNIRGLTEFECACWALLAGLPTASGFYLLRLCERILRELYKKESGKDVKKLTWGKILDELEDYYKDKERPRVLHVIKYLKDVRDSIAHPDKYLDQKKAEQLFNFVITVIEELRGELL